MARRSPKARLIADSSALVDAAIERGLTVAQVAELVGISPSTVSELLSADKPIRFKTATALRKNFGVDVVRVVGTRR